MSKKNKWLEDFFMFLWVFFLLATVLAVSVCLDSLKNKEINELEKEKLRLQIELLKLK